MNIEYFGKMPMPRHTLQDFSESEIACASPLIASDILTAPIQPRDLLISGAVGRGKTTLALALAQQITMQAIRTGGSLSRVYLRAQSLIRAQFSNERDVRRVLEDAERCSLLVLDDIGAEADIKTSEAVVCDLLSAREALGYGVTIATTNMIVQPEKLAEALGARVADRLMSYGLIAVKGEKSRRQEKRGEVKRLTPDGE